jgi:hypothetical protein
VVFPLAERAKLTSRLSAGLPLALMPTMTRCRHWSMPIPDGYWAEVKSSQVEAPPIA